MPWLSASQLGWIVPQIRAPQQIQQVFSQLGVSAEDFQSWFNYAMQQYGRTQAPGTAFTLGQPDLGQQLLTAPMPGGTAVAQPGQPPTTPTPQVAASVPGGVDQATVSAIIQAARDTGVDPALALAIAQKESGLNPNAIGDGGTSFGLFQLHIGGQLTSAGISPDEAMS